MFSSYRNSALRVSEQEARFAFVEAVLAHNFRYSIEVPTKEKYTFKTKEKYTFNGKGSRSAQTDLAVYRAIESRLCNVEFKAHGVSKRASKGRNAINKDMQKLLAEEPWGLWFHLLQSVDNSTIPKLLEVMEEEILKASKSENGVKSPGLSIHICVLEHGFSMHRDIKWPGHRISSADLKSVLRLQLGVTKHELKAVEDANGWNILRR